jgi:DNA-binding transcriptional MerR regulator
MAIHLNIEISREQAARALGISATGINALVAKGALTGRVTAAGRRVFTVEELERIAEAAATPKSRTSRPS